MLEKFKAKPTNHFSISFQNHFYYSFSKLFSWSFLYLHSISIDNFYSIIFSMSFTEINYFSNQYQFEIIQGSYNWQTPAIKKLQIQLVVRMRHWKTTTWYVVIWSNIHFPTVDSSYCTPANVGGLPSTASSGSASQTPVRQTSAA